ncbi:MAG: glycosyltransferase [Clostridia bacterium]|nr:glycosyltransferase [Clostridia bacterium]
MKKVLIFYGTYGGGHLAAARSIKEFIDSNYKDVEATMFDCIEYVNKYVNKVSTTAYKEMAKVAPWMWRKVYSNSDHGALSKISDQSNKIMARKLNKLIQEVNPDLIISTLPFSNNMCTDLKKKGKITCPIATVMTDMAPHGQWLVNCEFLDFFFVANSQMKKTLVTKYNINSNKIHITGIPLSGRFLNPNFDREAIFKEFNLDSSKNTVLFFAGGEFGLGRKKTRMILRALIRLFKNFQIIAISGKNAKMNHKFKEIVSLYHAEDRVVVLDYTNKVPELMSISNMVITKPGGLTITESLVSGLPIIIINPIPGQEEENAEFLVKNKVAVWLKKDDNVARFLKNLYRHPEIIDEMRNNIPNLAKPNSTADICRILFG